MRRVLCPPGRILYQEASQLQFEGEKGKDVSLGNLDCLLVFCSGFVQQLEKTFEINFCAMKTNKPRGHSV